MKYSKNIWDNIILITPNEGLSKQRYGELRLSGIPCKLYNGNIDNLKTKDEEIFIIEISKLKEERKGEGVSVDISYSDGKNLVFIDEGHKGAGVESETGWKSLREKVAKMVLFLNILLLLDKLLNLQSLDNPKGGNQIKQILSYTMNTLKQ